MSLGDKLSELSEAKKAEEQKELDQIEAAKQEALRLEQLEKDEALRIELEPTRQKIEDLENKKQQLELIKNSLIFKGTDDESLGMIDYSEKVVGRKETEEEGLNNLIKNHKDVLEPLHINSVEELVSNPDFESEPEVLSYKEAAKNRDELISSDSVLYNKLIELDIIKIDDKDLKSHNGLLSYEKAENKIDKKLELIEQELTIEKAKTPEGAELRDRVLEIASSEIIRDLPNLTFSANKNKEGAEELIFNNNNGRILIKDGYAKFNGWTGNEIVPFNMSAYEIKYGKDLARESLNKAYSTQLDIAFEKLDKVNQNNDKALEKDLDRCNQEKWSEARKSYDSFNDLTNNFKRLLESKSKELEPKGIRFNPEYPPNYGAGYKQFYNISEYDVDNNRIKNSMQYRGAYPPELYFDSLTEYINKREEQLKELFEVVSKIETNEDMDEFCGGYHSKLGDIHKKMLSLNFSEARRVDKTEYRQLNSYNSYDEASDHFRMKNKEREIKKNKILEKIDESIELVDVKKELESAIKIENFGGDPSHVDNEVKRLERNREDALDIMGSILRLEMDLPKENLIFKGSDIEVPSVTKSIKELELNISNKDKDLKTLTGKISEKRNNKPRIFGIASWETELKSMEAENKKMGDDLYRMKNDELRSLYSKQYFYIKTPEYSEIRKLVHEQKKVEGTPDEIFNELKIKVNEMATKKPSENVLRLNSEYKRLLSKLF